ncbi:hypothetical protein SPRG_14135 [Saprolegnia parasitica CBS 223.65]|uniref:Uncharacterized protein n=1 Tax=Saprolegnia parasitica (strain CBS 223.65) TaxID=695850 RepID=A0A067BQW3_SAPPC|nr:hypothetical protein SPRG_14135 [Saprolegnia parasitica CBS 223.65]KDO20904.1 hypothetical protein SPRG_14135 [Saprolegnia parasitica CBS 223.65]|eukprot:XP_012208393.1 hypothetical protein SPRG_14135 [Saprolegnia parasitica CBS 223.65]
MADEKWNWAELIKIKSEPSAASVVSSVPDVPFRESAPPRRKAKPAKTPAPYTNISQPQPLATIGLTAELESNKFGFTQTKAAPSDLDMSSAEEFSQLRVRDRVISADDMRANMEGRTNVRLAELESKHLSRLENEDIDWVTIGVVTSASHLTAPDGKKYVVWTISDLDNCIVSLFLYNDAYEAHWKGSTGRLVAVINPVVLPARESGKFALKVSDGHDVAMIGTSLDFGYCQSYTLGGRQCKIAVNMAKSRYCVIHLAQRLKDAGKGRQELNSAQTFRNDVFKDGDGVRNLSSGSYAPERAAKKAAPKRKAATHRLTSSTPPATMVSATGDVAMHVHKKHKLTTPSVANFKPSTIDDLKASLAQPPAKGSSMAQKSIVAKMLGIGAKRKNANLMQFMTQHQSSTPTTTSSSSSRPAVPPSPLATLPRRVSVPSGRPASVPRQVSAPLTGRSANVASLRATGMVAMDFDAPGVPSILQAKSRPR